MAAVWTRRVPTGGAQGWGANYYCESEFSPTVRLELAMTVKKYLKLQVKVFWCIRIKVLIDKEVYDLRILIPPVHKISVF